MKLALITDLHYGVRNDNVAYIDAMKRFLDNVFFPYLEEHNIKIIICLGDLLDRRKFVNYYTAYRFRNDFLTPLFDPMAHNPLEFYWILGNHDIYYRESYEVTAAYELARDFPIRIIDSPKEEDFGGLNVLMVPWITNLNKQQCYEALNTTTAKVVMGHFQIQGFEMFKGVVAHVGEDKDLFRRFDRVLSGHFHLKHCRDNIDYLGSVGDYSWAEYGSPHGFHIFETDSHELTFIENHYTVHTKVVYDDRTEDSGFKVDFDLLKGKNVRVIVQSLTNQDRFDWFMNQIYSASPINVQPVYENLNVTLNLDKDKIEDKDPLTVIRECVKMSNNVIDSSKLENLFIGLYQEAQNED